MWLQLVLELALELGCPCSSVGSLPVTADGKYRYGFCTVYTANILLDGLLLYCLRQSLTYYGHLNSRAL